MLHVVVVRTIPSVNAELITPTNCINCCFHGVAPTILPVLRSCKLSPPIAAAQHTTAPIKIAVAAPFDESISKKVIINRELNNIVAMVTPDIGLFEDPTTPAIYAATAENRNPNMHIINDSIIADPQDEIMPKYVNDIGASINTIAINT